MMRSSGILGNAGQVRRLISPANCIRQTATLKVLNPSTLHCSFFFPIVIFVNPFSKLRAACNSQPFSRLRNDYLAHTLLESSCAATDLRKFFALNWVFRPYVSNLLSQARNTVAMRLCRVAHVTADVSPSTVISGYCTAVFRYCWNLHKRATLESICEGGIKLLNQLKLYVSPLSDVVSHLVL